jgi:hypothetical protein
MAFRRSRVRSSSAPPNQQTASRIIALALLFLAPAAKQKFVVNVDFVAPPPLAALWREADDVVLLRVESSEPYGQPRGAYLPLVFTRHRGAVIEDLKRRTARKTITFLQRAGQLETETEVIEIEGDTPLPKEREYVVFLKRNAAGDLHVMYGPEGSFDLTTGLVVPRGSSKVATRHKGMTKARFLDRLRDLGR